ncbi:MAG: endonuclease III, partial [Nitrospira sp.]|nr:endonuclease III [Nitrospira sp.]
MTPRTPRSPRLANRSSEIAARLFTTMPDAPVELAHRSPWELLAATILSAQCTDRRVNQVTPALFARYRTPSEMAQAIPAELEALIKSTGFYKSKAKHLIGCGKALTERFDGEVPAAMEELTSLPGVGRKTANV